MSSTPPILRVAKGSELTWDEVDANFYNLYTQKADIDQAFIPWIFKTANYTASARDRIGVNTTSGSFTITLPSTPANGDEIYICDISRTCATNPLTIARNGNTIAGSASDLTVSTNGASFGLVFTGTTWAVY